MSGRRGAAMAAAALLLEFLPRVVAHGDDHGMDMGGQDAPSAPPQDAGFGGYWGLSEHVSLMYWHIALEIVAWVVVLPLAVMFSIARSPFTLPSQLVFLSTNALALVLGLVYNHNTPEMYAGNAHSKTGWAITWIASAWVFLALVQAYASTTGQHAADDEFKHPMTTANMLRYQRVQGEELPSPSRWSDDSGQGTERNSASLYDTSQSPSVESENQEFASPPRRYTHDDDSFGNDNDNEKHGLLRNTSVDRFFARNVARFAAGRTLKAMRFFYVAVERTILVQGLVAIISGAVVYGGIGRGGAVFNVLAHTIKGGIFFVYGFLTLGRWMGAFADFGWAWNVKPPKEVVGRRRAALPSAEFTESFVIWLYGCSNVFLEHLAAWGDAWTAQDLEHVSISIMFFGGGLVSKPTVGPSLSWRPRLTSFLVGHVHRVEQSARAPQQQRRRLAARLGRARVVAAAAPVPLLHEPYARPHHHAARQDDELAPPDVHGLDHDPHTMGQHVHGLRAGTVPHIHCHVHCAADFVSAVSPTDRNHHLFLPCRGRHHVHGVQQRYRGGSGVVWAGRHVHVHCDDGCNRAPPGVDHGRDCDQGLGSSRRGPESVRKGPRWCAGLSSNEVSTS